MAMGTPLGRSSRPDRRRRCTRRPAPGTSAHQPRPTTAPILQPLWTLIRAGISARLTLAHTTLTAAVTDCIEQWAHQPLRQSAPAEPTASYVRRPLGYTLEAFQAATPPRFEEMCHELLERDGFTNTERVGRAGDLGANPSSPRDSSPLNRHPRTGRAGTACGRWARRSPVGSLPAVEEDGREFDRGGAGLLSCRSGAAPLRRRVGGAGSCLPRA
ncbi:restriction endonuclease [Kitasatospora brasiliensis]|uniref:restriction endonuclease n=1 Tax=Kitasatospora brasiliensis TaxID=3058040 RepID=UPI003D77D8C3